MAFRINWRIRIKEVVVVGLLTVLFIAALPLLAVVALTVRVAFVALFVAGAIAILASPTFRRWVRSDSEAGEVHKGVRLSPDVMLHPHHAWARVDEGAEVTVGADDLAQRAIGPVEAVELPVLGTTVAQGQGLFRLRRGSRSITIRAPLAGRICGVNMGLQTNPNLLNQAPYGIGWAVKLVPDDVISLRKQLRRGRAANQWFRDEIDQFVNILSPPALASSVAQDGGELTENLHDQIDQETWYRLAERFFADKAGADSPK